MNLQMEDLMYQSGLTAQGCWDEMDEYDRAAIKKFAELIIRNCVELNRDQSYELLGVIVDTEESPEGFDNTCLNTVKCVHDYLLGKPLLQHFGIEE